MDCGAFGAQESHFRGGHPYQRVVGPHVHTAEAEAPCAVEFLPAAAQTHIFDIFEGGGHEVSLATGVGVAVHVADDVGCGVCVAAGGTAVVVIVHGGIQRVGHRCEVLPCSVVAVMLYDSSGYSLLGHLAGLFGSHKRYTHGQTQLQRVAEQNPFGGVAAVHIVAVGAQAVADVLLQGGGSVGKVFKERVVHGFLAVVGHGQIGRGADSRVGYGAVAVGDTAHGCYLYDFGNCQRHRIACILRLGFDLRVVGVEGRNDAVRFHEHAAPVVLGVIACEAFGEARVGVGIISAQSTAQKSVGELQSVDVGRHHAAGHIVHLRYQGVVVGGKVAGLVRVRVDILEVAGAGGSSNGQHRN